MSQYIMLLILLVSGISIGCQQTVLEEGRYNIEAKAGPNTVPVELYLEQRGDQYYGKMYVQLGTPLNIALRSKTVSGDTVAFYTSAPIRNVSLWSSAQDSILGELTLGNGFKVSMSGRIVGAEENKFSLRRQMQSVFGEGIISTPSRGQAFVTMNPDEDELLLSVYEQHFSHQTIYHSKKTVHGWTDPQVAWFSGEYSDRAPMFSPDGSEIYFGSTRPHEGHGEPQDHYDLWRITQREDGTWHRPQALSVLNTGFNEYQPSVTNRGLYFVSDREGGIGGQDIYFAPFTHDGGYAAPRLLSKNINTTGSEMSVFVDPDERYMIISSSNDWHGASGNDDLYLISKAQNQWGEPTNLGDKVNSFVNEYGAFVSRDGQTLYYGSDVHPPANIYRFDLGSVLDQPHKQ